MALRMIFVTDVFTDPDQALLDHCNLVILSEREDSQLRELPIIIVPRSGKRVEGEDIGARYLFWSEKVERVEYSILHLTSGVKRHSVYLLTLDKEKLNSINI